MEYYSEDMPVNVFFDIEHDSCWTNITEDRDITIHTINHDIFKERNYIIGSIEVKAPTNDAFKNFIREFKKSSIIKEILEINILDKQKRIYEVIFKEQYDNMIMSLLYEHKAINPMDSIQNNIESISSTIPENEASDLKKELEKIGEVKYFKIAEPKRYRNAHECFELTDQEAYAIYVALKNGYYNMPHEVYLKDLSEITGLSKSSLAEYLRKGMDKIILNWGEKNMFFIEKKIKMR